MSTVRLLAFPSKASPVPADIIYAGDSANSFDEVQITIAELIGAYPALLGIGGLSLGANSFPYVNSGSTFTAGTITALAISLLADTTTAAMQATLGISIGSNVQPFSAALTSIAGLTTVANEMLYTTAANTYATIAAGTSGQLLQVSAGGAPGWSTTSYPATNAINTLLYASSANVMAALATANSSVLITSAGGIPSLSQTLPTAVQGNVTQLGAQSQALNMNNFGINNLATPVNANDAVTKAYADNIAAGFNPISAVYAASTANLTGYTYSNGAAGIGATLTAGSTGVFTVDGVSPPVGARFLYKNDTTGSGVNNGIYTVTTSAGGSPAVLTRATDYNTPGEIEPGDLVSVENGTVNAGSSWYETATIVTIGVTPIAFSVFFSPANFVSSTLATGKIFIGNGSNIAVASTATYPVSTTINQLLYSSSANVIAGLATANNSILATNGSGVPAFTTAMPTAVQVAVASLNSGTSASATTFWRGDGTWATPGVTNTALQSYIAGCLPSAIAGTSTTATVTVGAGTATDSTSAASITSAGYSWAVSNGNAINGYAGGATLPNSSTIHFFVCTGGSGTGSFASTSLTPTFPTGYNTYFRRIFSLNTTSAGALIPGTALETEGGSLTFYLTTQILDISTTTQGTTAVLYTLTVPAGIKMQVMGRWNSATSSACILMTSPDETDVAPGGLNFATAPGADWVNSGAFEAGVPRDGFVTTNTSGQVRFRSNTASSSLYYVTRGFRDFRRT